MANRLAKEWANVKLLQFPTCWPIKGLFVHWSRGWGVLSFSERLVFHYSHHYNYQQSNEVRYPDSTQPAVRQILFLRRHELSFYHSVASWDPGIIRDASMVCINIVYWYKQHKKLPIPERCVASNNRLWINTPRSRHWFISLHRA